MNISILALVAVQVTYSKLSAPLQPTSHVNSPGALIILGLFSNKWSVKECITRFQSFSTLAFRGRRVFGLQLKSLGIFRRFFEILFSFVTDSKYDSSGITEALVSAFGETHSMFEQPCGGAKVAVVAATIEDATTCIFTNYNGPEKRPQDCGQ
jgi:hypothetical protein